ncbi:MAG: histidinol-phosphate transaminase [Lachnospiraceae bacterium]|nr:histidinol-phosphate transaminase [Lachnospiraceae bacterium]
MGFEDRIRKVVPYVPGEQPKAANVIKLNTNESPYPPSPKVKEALQELDADRLRLYPDPAASELVNAIAEYYGLSEKEVFVGVGSDDVLAMCFMTFFNSEDPILFPDITYSFYDVWADLLRIPYRQLPLDENFDIRPEDYTGRNGGVIFPNPNAPTGALLPLEQIRQIARANQDSIVIIDEAYIDFGGESALPLIHEFKNVVVTQTFSKSRNLAGLRIGCAMADEKLIKYLNDVKYSFNSYTMNMPAIKAGAAAIRDRAYFESCTAKIRATRERATKMLRDLGFELRDSSANFVFATHPQVDAKEIFDYLKSKNIFVRWWGKPRINRYLRITIGTDREMEALGEALKSFLKEKGLFEA